MCFILALAFGNWSIWAVLGLAVVTAGGIDEAVGDDQSRLADAGRFFFDVNLYATLPLVISMTYFLLVQLGSRPSLDPGIVSRGIPENPGKALPLAAAVIGTGYFYALAGVTVAHELTHR